MYKYNECEISDIITGLFEIRASEASEISLQEQELGYNHSEVQRRCRRAAKYYDLSRDAEIIARCTRFMASRTATLTERQRTEGRGDEY